MKVSYLARHRRAVVFFCILTSMALAVLGARVLADGGGGTPATDVVAEIASDSVAATAAEFRVDESGAATYSIPLYTVPGTAGVAPELSLNYSSQGGIGPMGRGWSIGGGSSIQRCRSTREAGDFISGGVAVDGTPRAINYTASDRFCLDGQRLLPGVGGEACPAASGASGRHLRTEIESFQRVCAYSPDGDAANPAFFTVERKDGSISWYGDRDNSDSANRPDGYVETNTPGHTRKALTWAQTRFQDSTGNYIDYIYIENPGAGAGSAEHLLREVRYTGKTVLPGQNGPARAPYARVVFGYGETTAAKWSSGYLPAGGTRTQRHRLNAISVCTSLNSCAVSSQARYYVLSYAASNSGSTVDQLVQLQECRDSSKAVCMSPTTFEWSGGKYDFSTIERPGNLALANDHIRGFKTGDINGDGRQDIAFLYLAGHGCVGGSWVISAISAMNGAGAPTFSNILWNCVPNNIVDRGDGAWHLFDYDGDGRDDLFVSGPTGQGWRVHPGTDVGFDMSRNLISGLSPIIPSLDAKASQVQLADLNGDGLVDIIYPVGESLQARLMQRSGKNFSWGAPRTVVIDQASLGALDCFGTGTSIRNCGRSISGVPTTKTNFTQMSDFDGDASSDILLRVTTRAEYWVGGPGCNPQMPLGGATLSEDWDPDLLGAFFDHDDLQQPNAPGGACWQVVRTDQLHAMTMKSLSASAITLTNYGAIGSGNPEALVIADLNGDGLSDVVSRATSSSDWVARINTGSGFTTAGAGTLPLGEYREHARFVDINGDGRADMLYLANNGVNKVYHVRYSLPNGGFSNGVVLPGGNARLCEGSGCDPGQRSSMFMDVDGDGVLDFLSFNFSTANLGLYVSRSASRFVPRDVVQSFTNGFGSRTEIVYAPLTNKDVYRRDSGARALNWGRGSPVMEFLAPTYVVASASSSSPQHGAPGAMATLHYRYTGGKVQSGGRGFLGFRQIVSFDVNQSGGYVATATSYAQNFPFVGMPMTTVKRVFTEPYSLPSCLGGEVGNHCFIGPGQAFPAVGGSTFSTAQHEWEGDSDIGAAVRSFAPGEQRPIHVRTLGTSEVLRDPFTNTNTSRVETAFDYGSYGNATLTNVDTYSGGGTLISTLSTANNYANYGGWKLGRLTGSVVTHSRPNRESIVRKASFVYENGGAKTGQLLAERREPNGDVSMDLRTHYNLDEYGNRTRETTCAAPATNCATAAFDFMPASRLRVHRYVRTVYDGAGRYPVETWEPFRTTGGSAEARTSRVVARDRFGNVTRAYDHNGRDSFAVFGSFGRAYYTWQETVPGSVPGDPEGGITSMTTYRWCGGTSGQVTCPVGARIRQQIVKSGSPSSWQYLDMLGRPVLQLTQSFNVGSSGKDVVAVCTGYDAVGRPTRVSNPFFLSGKGVQVSASTCTSAGLKWTTTMYDVIGRPVQVIGPDGAVVRTTYAGVTTTVTDPRGNATAQTRNALGEISRVVDAVGTTMTYIYNADGTLQYVHRDVGRGQVRNTFQYDIQGRKLRQVDPDAGTTDFEYNALGELIAQQHASGSRIEYEIDARGRTWRKTVRAADGTIETTSTFEYDTAANGRGQLAREAISGSYAAWQAQPSLAHAFTRTHRYDLLGRPVATTTTIDGRDYINEIVYDASGRIWQQLDASGRWSQNAYNTRGFLRAVCYIQTGTAGCNNSATYNRIIETNPWGSVVRERRGDKADMDVMREYWEDTGRIAGICAGNIASCELMDEGYAWDAAGNLHTHVKESRYMETFTYDALNRLSSATLAMRNGVSANQSMLAQDYDRLGNVCHRDEGGVSAAYSYAGRAGCGLGSGNSDSGAGGGGARAHAVTSFRGMTYGYDSRGNQTTRSGGGAPTRTIRYSQDDHAYEITMGNGSRIRFWYGPDGQRYKREDQDGKRTLYLGNVEIDLQGSASTIRRVVAGVVQQTIIGTTATNRYLFHDHLGSLVRITNSNGTVQGSQDYRAYGERRSYTEPGGLGVASTTTPRGFTGHEHLDGLDVIHMNGRIYDPVLHRFLQADPVIQSPDNLQSWNAYTYVFNNPLAYTDPSGMISLRQVLGIVVGVVAAVFGQYYISQGAWAAAFAVAAAGGFASAYIATGSFRSGVIGALAGMSTLGIGIQFSGMEAIAAHAVSGGIVESLQGGKFGNAFFAAGLSSAFMPQTGRISGDVKRAAAGALIGGTISAATGGKFANGAVSGAIQAALAQRNVRSTKVPRESSDLSDVPNERLKSLMLSRKADDRLEAAREASKYFGIDDDGVNYVYNSHRNAHPGVMLMNGDLVLGAKAFSSWARLGSVLGHEIEVHWRVQIVGRRWENSPQRLWAGEYEAYKYNVDNAARFGNGVSDVEFFRREMDRAFRNLTTLNQQSVRDGKYEWVD
ncbi:FG-GAP-like repeat-containing protein [Luteimonas sp. RC10]|uniref:FG-GAP-like repeat-containing protein n=1 Tax=Luteimonas sp. RC10 TaxID=2587035 RepID=UPI0016097ACB|nr:FG-GAP-like repeat-containing protein [Luteimonas sp. RC10]MBB3343133.1 RHS repeat-associated protein [Luteimonas sp. RC10]